MSERTPTASEAQAALAQARSHSALVRRMDHQLAWMLLTIAAVYLLAAGVISLLPDSRRGGPVVGLAVLAIVIAGVVGLTVVGLRIRAYSRAAILLYVGGVVAFNVWNALVSGLSIGTRWWAATQPSYHFGLSALVSVVPLLVVAWLIARR